MSKNVTKVDGSIDEKNGLKYTVGDRSLGLLSTIDKALGGMLKDEETQLKCSPEYAEGATIDPTLVQVTKKHVEKAISDKTVTFCFARFLFKIFRFSCCFFIVFQGFLYSKSFCFIFYAKQNF